MSNVRNTILLSYVVCLCFQTLQASMLSLNLESITDDDLFGSGAWNNQPSAVTEPSAVDTRQKNMTAQNGDVYDASNTPVVQVLF